MVSSVLGLPEPWKTPGSLGPGYSIQALGSEVLASRVQA